jgi:FixJ family two-component response regulator
VIDDDDGIRTAVLRLLGAAGMTTAGYASAEELLRSGVPSNVACIIGDMKLGGMSGLDLFDELRAKGEKAPFILITAHDTTRARTEARLRGADFLAKPFAGETLLEAVKSAIQEKPTPL